MSLMKLKYYMRGLGIGILLTTLLFALSGYQKKLSDQEIIERAEKLGMVTAAKEEDPLDKVLGDMVPEKEKDTEETTPAAETTLEAGTTPGAAEGKTTEPTTDAGGKTMEPSGESDAGKTTETNGESPEGKTTDSNGEPAEGQAAGQTSEQNMKPAEGKTTNSSAATETDAQTGYSEVTITIKQGMTSDSVSKLLYKAGIVDDAKEFNNYIIKAGKSTKILIGEFTIRKGASYDDIIKMIAE